MQELFNANEALDGRAVGPAVDKDARREVQRADGSAGRHTRECKQGQEEEEEGGDVMGTGNDSRGNDSQESLRVEVGRVGHGGRNRLRWFVECDPVQLTHRGGGW